jgi:hypothetical protein
MSILKLDSMSISFRLGCFIALALAIVVFFLLTLVVQQKVHLASVLLTLLWFLADIFILVPSV